MFPVSSPLLQLLMNPASNPVCPFIHPPTAPNPSLLRSVLLRLPAPLFLFPFQAPLFSTSTTLFLAALSSFLWADIQQICSGSILCIVSSIASVHCHCLPLNVCDTSHSQSRSFMMPWLSRWTEMSDGGWFSQAFLLNFWKQISACIPI